MGFPGDHTDTQLLLAFFSANCPPSNKQLLQSGKQLPLNGSATGEWQINGIVCCAFCSSQHMNAMKKQTHQRGLWPPHTHLRLYPCESCSPAQFGEAGPGASASPGKAVMCVPTRLVLEAEANSCSYIRCWALHNCVLYHFNLVCF